MPAPPFKKTSPCTILPPFLNFSESLPPGEVIKIYFPPALLGFGSGNKYACAKTIRFFSWKWHFFDKKHHSRQKKIYNSVKTCDILMK